MLRFPISDAYHAKLDALALAQAVAIFLGMVCVTHDRFLCLPRANRRLVTEESFFVF